MDLLAPSPSGTGIRAVWRTADVAEFWQRSPQTVWRWIHDGQHPAARHDPGGRPYWDPAEILAFAYGRHTGGTATRHDTDVAPDPGQGLTLTIGGRQVDDERPTAPATATDDNPGLRLVIGDEVVR